jgi:hypothetical protein
LGAHIDFLIFKNGRQNSHVTGQLFKICYVSRPSPGTFFAFHNTL